MRTECFVTLGWTGPCFFFFNDTATTEIYTLSLHDALPISVRHPRHRRARPGRQFRVGSAGLSPRSEEHTSELQSQSNLVCRLLLEKKKTNYRTARGTPAPAALNLHCPHTLGAPSAPPSPSS